MSPREGDSIGGPGSDLDAREGDRCAPVRATAAEELEGLFRFAVARLGGGSGGQGGAAEDVVQQAVLIALSHASPPPEAERQRAWLRGIVRNVIRHRARSGRRGREAALRLSRGMDEAAGASPSAQDGERAGRVRALFLAVTELSSADQELFYAVYRAGRSHASVAEELGTTVKGVEARLYRMRGRLRRALESVDEGAA